MQLGLVLSLAFALVIALFAVQNTTPVALNFLTLHVDQVAVSLLVLGSAMLGAALTFAFGLPREVGHRREKGALREQLRVKERAPQPASAISGHSADEAILISSASEEGSETKAPPLPNPPPPGGRE
ncbi:MAG TPA: LapA family protein [Chloroflexota bacterium]